MSTFRTVEKAPDHTSIEHAVLERWERERTFETLRERNRGNEPWSFIDGPITANNPMGVHHAWGRTLKDIWQRYHAMLGHDQRYQNGFDCQGLWVEVEVEKALGLNSKREIEEYGIDRFARACRDRVAQYAAVITDQSKRLGMWMDWENSYFTMTDTNISYIWRFLAECHRRGWLYIGHRSMPWCPRCGTSLSQHELIDAYEEITHPSLYVRFPLVGKEHEYLTVWTTTPWTLPANVAAAVKPDADYARIQTAGGIAYVAAARVDHVPIKGKVLGTVKGSELVGLTYEGPFDHLPAQSGVVHTILPWPDVSLEEGTGIVHIAPGCGAEDFDLGKIHDLPVLIPIDESGAFYEQYGWLHGRHTAEAAQQIIGELGERGRMIEAGSLTHRYPTCWRCHTELVWRVVDEWFINCDEIREPMIEAARTVEWQPPQYGKRMEDWLRNMGDWCFSRKRYWGLPVPFWFCADNHMTIVESKQDLLARAVRGTEGLQELHRPWIDDVIIACGECGKEATRVKDVGDCWLDAGVVPFSTLGWQNDTFKDQGYAEGAGVGLTGADLPDHATWEKWFPADWISEMREQIRLWFYSLLFMSVVLEGRAPYKRVLTYEKVNDETGRPMHKSWGNMIEANEAMEHMGADVMRWLYAAQPPAQNLNFGYGPAGETKRRFLTLWNTYSFLIQYANIEGWQPERELLERGPSSDHALDRWALARTQHLIAKCKAALDDYDSPRLVRAVETYWEELSNWYVRLSRARFYGGDDPSAFETLWYCLVQLIRCVAPVMPFITEEMWGNLVARPLKNAEPSVHLSAYPAVDAALTDQGLLDAMRSVQMVVELGRAARAEANLKVRQPLSAVIVATESAQSMDHLQQHLDLIRAELNVKDVRFTNSAEEFAQLEIVPNFRALGPKLGKDVGKVQAALKKGDYERKDGRVLVAGVTLEEGEFEIRTRAREGFAIVDGDGFAVALDTEITPELALEGRARDLIRAIQDARKAAGLELTDRIHVTYAVGDADVFEKHGEWIAREVLAVAQEQGAELAVTKQ